ncbi:MAG: PhnD/SsuA/transferrin family substrate-binding protein [Pseudomonadota bacterium]
MYDHPAARWATDQLWDAIASHLRAAGIDAPEALTRERDYSAQWREPELLLSQTCGYPYMFMLRGTARLVATPCYRAEGCEGPRYRSVLIARTDDQASALRDFRGRRVAFNATHSQSGYNCLRAAIAPLSGGEHFFSAHVETGRHVASLQAVASGEADLCAVDCVTWGLEMKHVPGDWAGLKVIGMTDSAPGLPYITSLQTNASTLGALRSALLEVAGDPGLKEARHALLLDGFEVLSDEDYAVIPEMEEQARALGYPELI